MFDFFFFGGGKGEGVVIKWPFGRWWIGGVWNCVEKCVEFHVIFPGEVPCVEIHVRESICKIHLKDSV